MQLLPLVEVMHFSEWRLAASKWMHFSFRSEGGCSRSGCSGVDAALEVDAALKWMQNRVDAVGWMQLSGCRIEWMQQSGCSEWMQG